MGPLSSGFSFGEDQGMKTALVHDWLVTPGGSETVLEALYALYPSHVYTLIANARYIATTSLAQAAITTSFIERLPWAQKCFRHYLPLFPLAIEQFDLTEHDLVISSSHAVAKGVLTHEGQVHICYCHTPMRYVWRLYHAYKQDLGTCLARALFSWTAHRLRMWDFMTAPRVDYFVANSKHVQERIRKIYGRSAEVIYPPVDTSRFDVASNRDDYYLTASRLVGYKRVDLIVRAFSRMPEKRLLVVGDGPEISRLKRLARSNIEILGYRPDKELGTYLRKARAFVFAAQEDFGILPVEAQACGTPVIAYGIGGASETVIDNVTGVLFSRQTEEALIKAVNRFERLENRFDPWVIRRNAERFDTARFNEAFARLVREKMELHEAKRSGQHLI